VDVTEQMDWHTSRLLFRVFDENDNDIKIVLTATTNCAQGFLKIASVDTFEKLG
jgi:hypothetical protein